MFEHVPVCNGKVGGVDYGRGFKRRFADAAQPRVEPVHMASEENVIRVTPAARTGEGLGG